MVRVFLGLLCGWLLPASPVDGSGPDEARAAVERSAAVRRPETEAEARRNLDMDTERAEAWLDLGRILFEGGRVGDLDEALDCLNRAVGLDPDLATAWFWLGRASGQAAGRGGVLKRIQSAHRAREAFTRAVGLEPGNFRFTYALLQFHLQAPAMAGGRRELATGLADGFDPGRPDERALLQAALHLADRDFPQTFERLDEVGPLSDPLVAETWKTLAGQLGSAQLERREWSGAAEAYRLMTGRLPGVAAGWLGLGRALAGLDRPGAAATAFRQCLEVALPGPEAEAATRELARLGFEPEG